ncbi:hypothetical protein TWF106_005897 [Orbilia oligospora]|uniref:Uncharacterized protein n=1 Tax=Orbilia oligospora TaxID=2813651 RepID=A0A6G1LZ20_ORBOL|nr:hypothetical protein TWF788_010753 [Orbilia oligospora]KAF3195027.1 hypothetical protein TWF106_005897 [Orbilia oligospora]KAF3196657.1 hypothetical protein TWF679_004569 [Orbilia oligospora]KAF3203661.1 hypothetical protein TWF191_002583 [Orbilia oligospora]KAF3237690.1 hypothetical protein TWF192_010800 [Orbilia oligospora]
MATTSSPSPRPVFTASPSPQAHFTALIATSPSPTSQHVSTSPTPPPRPPSSPGISVFAPRPMRVPMYRPQFPRPVFLYDSDTVDSKENTQAASATVTATATATTTASAVTSTRRSSVASTGIPEEGLDSKLFNTPKDVLDELYKIIRPTSASSASTTGNTQPPSASSPNTYMRHYPFNPRTPTNTSHRRHPSDASDGGLSNILHGLSVLAGNPRASPDSGDWRSMHPAVSPVARRAINPMVRDPSFQGESQKKD